MTFSFIVPTRQRPAVLRRFLDSVKATTRNPDALEVVLVIDDDDEESRRFEYSGVLLRRVRVPPGSSMGAMNRAGCAAASGQYLMLLNDDVLLRTPGWDEHVLRAFRSCPDGFALIHVNDLLFGETLCTFPFVTREACELMNGICPPGYIRYRIDDHIHHIFDLLGLLGLRRRIFLPEVVFEHVNAGGTYVPDPLIHTADTWLFHSLLTERKAIAVEAARRIGGSADLKALPELREQDVPPGPARLNPLAHFLEAGASAGRKPHPLFDPIYYLSKNPDVASAGINPLAHFLECGARKGRRPNPLFDTAYYLERNPEVAETGMNPLEHFVESGCANGCKPNPLFDPGYYLEQNPDVASAGTNPLAHFLESGAKEGRRPNPLFDTAYYLECNPDVAESGMNPLEHFLEVGWANGCKPNPLFDPGDYIAQNPDVFAAGINPLAHFLESGARQGR